MKIDRKAKKLFTTKWIFITIPIVVSVLIPVLLIAAPVCFASLFYGSRAAIKMFLLFKNDGVRGVFERGWSFIVLAYEKVWDFTYIL